MTLTQSHFHIHVVVSINSLLISSRCTNVFPMVHTLTIVEPIWPMLQNSALHVFPHPCV